MIRPVHLRICVSVLECMFSSIAPWVHDGTDVCQYCQSVNVKFLRPLINQRRSLGSQSYPELQHTLRLTVKLWVTPQSQKRRTDRKQKRQEMRVRNGDDSSDINKIWVQKKIFFKKGLSHKSFSFPPLQELINHPFTVLWSSSPRRQIWVGIQRRPNLG